MMNLKDDIVTIMLLPLILDNTYNYKELNVLNNILDVFIKDIERPWLEESIFIRINPSLKYINDKNTNKLYQMLLNNKMFNSFYNRHTKEYGFISIFEYDVSIDILADYYNIINNNFTNLKNEHKFKIITFWDNLFNHDLYLLLHFTNDLEKTEKCLPEKIVHNSITHPDRMRIIL